MGTFLVILLSLTVARATDWGTFTDLDAYVGASEDVYGYELLTTDIYPGYTMYVLNMTSLTWFDDTLTTQPVWWHYQTVVIPDNLIYTDAVAVYVYGGDNDDGHPSLNDTEVSDMVDFAVNTGAVTTLVTQVPNQPMYFVDEANGTRPRSEDAIIGYTWKLFIEETVTEPEVIILFPMVKAAKQAVDTVIDFAASVNPAIQITEFMPTGRSKRGWVSWLLGCVDQRVFAIAPVVFDLLNFYENLQGHYMSMGGWSWAFAPYWNVEVPKYLHHPNTQIIGGHIDPLVYNERLTMPKHLHGATGDEFFLPDGTHTWFYNITGEFHYTLFPDQGHSISDVRPQMWENIQSLFVNVKEAAARPEYYFTRTIDPTGQSATISLTSVTSPSYVKVWWADTTNRTCEPDDDVTGTCRRDFRLDRLDAPTDTMIYHTEDVPVDLGNGMYEASYSFRTDFGFRVFHMEVGYPGAGGRLMMVTSESAIIPDIHPYSICVTEEECQGELK